MTKTKEQFLRNNKGQFIKGHQPINFLNGCFKKGFIPWNKGKIGLYFHSETAKKKIAKGNKGKIVLSLTKYKLSEARRKQIPPMLGKLHSIASREWMSKLKIGEKSYNWKGGITPINKRLRHSLRFREWRTRVFSRDNYTCWICGERGGILHPHHLKRFFNYLEERFKENNGITLCEFCHKMYTEYGPKISSTL